MFNETETQAVSTRAPHTGQEVTRTQPVCSVVSVTYDPGGQGSIPGRQAPSPGGVQEAAEPWFPLLMDVLSLARPPDTSKHTF